MITEALIRVLISPVNTIFTVLGLLPDMPVAITDVADQMQVFTVSGMGLFFGIFGKFFVLATLGAIVTLVAHTQIWHTISWGYHKIRG